MRKLPLWNYEDEILVLLKLQMMFVLTF